MQNITMLTFFGTDGKGVLYALRHYGLGVRGLTSQRAVEEALLRGNVVLTAQQHGSYGYDTITHMVVLNSYDNGFTYVVDPTYPHKNSRYDVMSLWRDKSYDPDDTNAGFVFYELIGNEAPSAPEKPAEPEKPAKPDNPKPEEPKPETPKPEIPEETPKPEIPAEPEAPEETPKPEIPVEPETPEETPKPDNPDDSENSNETDHTEPEKLNTTDSLEDNTDE